MKPATFRVNPAEFQDLYNKAHAAGLEAGNTVIPTPMVVVERANPLDDSSRVIKQYAPVWDGCCGFAWITIKPGNCAFANWLKKNDLARKAYNGGVEIWVGLFNQSVTRKEAYAAAFAEVLVNAGIYAFSGSRMD